MLGKFRRRKLESNVCSGLVVRSILLGTYAVGDVQERVEALGRTGGNCGVWEKGKWCISGISFKISAFS